MKKLFFFASVLLLSAGVAHSQEAFKHLSVGLEAATTGVGLELALPVVSDHLVFAAGYNFGNVKATAQPYTLNVSDFSNNINQYVEDANYYLSSIPGESSRLKPIPTMTTVDGNGTIRLGTFKAILEYYPSKKSNFHINAGLYIGNADVLTLDVNCPDLWNAYRENLSVATNMISKYPDYASYIGRIPELKAKFNGKTYQIKEPGNINLGLKVAKVRPYLGLGFGRSIPDTHFGFQFDLGVMYTGKWGISSTNEVGGDAENSINNDDIQKLIDLANKICIYPQLSFRLIYRIF